MNFISYKFWYITRDDDGFITKAAIRFYEGDDMDIEIEDFETKEKKIENRYIRINILSKEDVSEIKGEWQKDAGNNDCKVYTEKDFGKIKSDDEFRLFCNKEMHKHKSRPNQKDQAELVDVNNVK